MASVEKVRVKKDESKSRSSKKKSTEVTFEDLAETVPSPPSIEDFLPELKVENNLCESQTVHKVDVTETEPCLPYKTLSLSLLEAEESSEILQNRDATLEADFQSQCEISCPSAPPQTLEEKFEFATPLSDEENLQSIQYAVQPFTESQLRGLYVNRELTTASEYVNKFLSDETDTPSDPFFKLLEDYCCSRQSLLTTEKSFQKLTVSVEEDKVNLWNLFDSKSEVEAECQDHLKVTSVHTYQTCQFNATISANLTTSMKQIRELLLEQVSVYLFQSNLKRLEVEEHLNKVCGSKDVNQLQILRCISVLFNFMRRRHNDEKFVKDVKLWLEQAIETLYHRFDDVFEHHLFLLNHVLRSPPGMGKWCASFIQPPAPIVGDQDEDVDFQNLQLNQMLALVSILFSPVRERKEYLPEYLVDLSRTPNKAVSTCEIWTVLDSDGEEEPSSPFSHSQPLMRENDIVAIFNQMPIDSMFRYLLRIQQRDGEDVYDPSNFTLSGFVKFCAFATQFIELLKCGLETFNAPTYQQFAKRIGRLVSQTVQYVSDHWQAYYISCGSRLDPAMCQRIQVEHDSFFLRAVNCILSSRNMGMWQYLAVLPFNYIGTEMLWKTYANLNFVSAELEGYSLDKLHTLDSDETVSFFQSQTVKSKFLESFESLSSNERIFLLTTFSKMASSRSYQDKSFIETVFIQLVEVGFLTPGFFDNCNKAARDLLSDISGTHPWVISFFVGKIFQSKHIMGMGKNLLHLVKFLQLSLWRPDENTFFMVSQWLTEYPPSSIESHLARIIFEKMDWTIQEKLGEPTRRALTWNFHQSLALSIVETNIKHSPDIIQEEGFLQEGIRHMSNIASFLYKKSPEQMLTSWSWEMVSKLRLHSSDQSFEETSAFFQGCQKSQISKLDDYVELSASVTAKSPIACYVALLLTDLGNCREEIISKGLSCLELLTTNGRFDHVMEVLLHLVPIFIRFPEQLAFNGVLKKVIETIVFDDQSYLQNPIELMTSDGPSPVLKEFANMITKQLLSYPKYGLLNEVPLTELWTRILTRLNKWNTNKNTLFLIDSICRTVFNKIETRAKLKAIMFQVLEEMRSVEKGGFFSWKTDDLTCITLIPISSGKYPWFSFVALEVEESSELFQKTWPALVTECSFDDSIAVESALKTVAQSQGIQAYGCNNLPIYKWSKLILDTPADHPMQPLLAQKFFHFYLSRQSSSYPAIGPKFFMGIVNSMYFGRLQTKLKAILEFYEGTDGANLNNTLKEFFNACALWSEDQMILSPTLHLPSLSPAFLPEKLSLLINKSEDLWLELINFEALRRLDDQSSMEWDKLHFRDAFKPLPSRPRLLSSEMLPSERIIQRLRSNDGSQPRPSSRPISPPLYSFSDKMVVNATVLRQTLSPIVLSITDFSRDFLEKKLECSALIGSMSELVEGLYLNTEAEVYLKASCQGSYGPKGEKLGCAGSATVKHKFLEARKQEVIEHQLTSKREAFEKLCHTLLFQPPSQKVLASIMLLENIAEFIVLMYLRYSVSQAPSEGLQNYGDLASTLFYLIVDECLCEEALVCPPIKFSLSSCLERLGDAVISKRPNDVIAIVSRLTSRPSLSPVLAQFFNPELLTNPTFIYVYQEICKISESSSDTSLVMLSKMSIDNWNSRCLPSAKEKLELISLIGSFLKRSGLKPKEESKLLHEIHKSNLVKTTVTDLENLLGSVVTFLLAFTESQSLDPLVWIDITNGLFRGAYTFRITDSLSDWATKSAAFADAQTGIQLPVIIECVKRAGLHFNKERRNVGLHGLYMKYPEYVKPLTAFFSLCGHLLVALMAKQTKSLQPDLRVTAIWNQIVFLFEAWVTPLHDGQLQEAATWIQQLAGNQKLLMPWAPSDVKIASVMTTMMMKCAEFLHFVVPARKSSISLIWEFYCHHFAHPEVRDYVLIIIHEVMLNNVQWTLFNPTDEDLRLMGSVIDSFLPISHEFLGRIFVDALPEIFCRSQWELVRVVSPIFHLVVKLSSEPQVRANGRLLPIIRNASSIPWSLVDCHTYENIILWYTMSVDCKVVIDHDQMHPLDTCILSLLKEVSCPRAEENEPSNNTRKFQDYIRCTSRLLVSCSNKQKSFLSSQVAALKVTLSQLIDNLNEIALKVRANNGITTNLLENLVRDSLAIFNSNSASLLPETALEVLSNKSSKNSKLCKELLFVLVKMAPSAVHDPLRVAKIVEFALEELFSDQGDDLLEDNEVSTWDEVFKNVVVPKEDKLNQIVDQACQSGCCLAIYGFYGRRQFEKVSDEQSVLNTLLTCLKKLRLSSSCEPKLPLFYTEILHLIKRQLNVGQSHYVVIKFINEFLVTLTSIGLESDGSWNFLSALTFSSPYRASVRAKFLALALALFLRSQMLKGPSLRTNENYLELEEKNDKLAYLEEAELTRLREALDGMKKNLGILDVIEWALQVTQDPKKTFDAADGFLHHLVVIENIYTERYLLTQSDTF